MKFTRQAILAILMLGTISGSASAMYSQYDQFNNMGMFGKQGMYMPQQQRPTFQQFARPMMSTMMNQFVNDRQASPLGEYAFMALTNWMMTGQPQFLQTAINYSVRNFTNNYYPQSLKNIWWARVIIDTALSRLTTVGVPKLMIMLTGNKAKSAK